MTSEKRLIDANALKANFVVLGEFAKDLWHAVTIRSAIDNAPTVDAVPVVRCKDCKYFYYDTANEPSCESLCGMVVPNEKGFCSYGERKDNE